MNEKLKMNATNEMKKDKKTSACVCSGEKGACHEAKRRVLSFCSSSAARFNPPKVLLVGRDALIAAHDTQITEMEEKKVTLPPNTFFL